MKAAASSSSSSSGRRPFMIFFFFLASLLISPSCLLQAAVGAEFGVNYGRLGDNLPPPDQAVALLRSHGINKVKLFDADPLAIAAFADSGIGLSITVPNGLIAGMGAPNSTDAETWVQQHVQPFFPRARITHVLLGSEVDLTNDNNALMSSLVPAMQSVHKALAAINLHTEEVLVSTSLSFAVMNNTYPSPPSAASFRQDLADTFIKPVLDFISQTSSSFVINPVPFFSYKSNPDPKALPYMLFQPNPGFLDPATNLRYDNLLYAEIDSVYAALNKMGYPDIKVLVGETGWPSMGNEEPGVTLQNAAAYNGNLIKRLQKREGTPMKPFVPVEAYIFALFNENLKTGPTSERNWRLFHPDGTLVYNVRIPAPSPPPQLQLPPPAADVSITIPDISITVPAGKEEHLPPTPPSPSHQRLPPPPKASPRPPPPPPPPSSTSSSVQVSTWALCFWMALLLISF